MTNNTNTTNTNKADLIAKISSHGYDTYYFADVAFLIAEGNDYDEECQKATDTIAMALGLPTLAENEEAYAIPAYELVNEFVNEQVSAQMAEYFADKDEE